jgi:hypothetical protein
MSPAQTQADVAYSTPVFSDLLDLPTGIYQSKAQKQ